MNHSQASVQQVQEAARRLQSKPLTLANGAQAMEDVLAVVDAFLPELDETLITEDWLRKIGWIFDDGDGDYLEEHWHHPEQDWLGIWNFNDECWLVKDIDEGELKTRGQLRTLCRALGVTLKEPTA